MGVIELQAHRSCFREGWVVGGLGEVSPQHLEALHGRKKGIKGCQGCS